MVLERYGSTLILSILDGIFYLYIMNKTDTHRVVFRQKSGTYEVRTLSKKQKREWYRTNLLYSGSEDDCIAYAEKLNKKLINT